MAASGPEYAPGGDRFGPRALARHAPDPVLVGDEQRAVPPGQPVGPIEAPGIALARGGPPAAVVAQQQHLAFALRCHQHVAVRQHEQTARVPNAGRERCRRETRRHIQPLPRIRNGPGPVADRALQVGRRQRGRVDAEPAPDLVLGREIAAQRDRVRSARALHEIEQCVTREDGENGSGVNPGARCHVLRPAAPARGYFRPLARSPLSSAAKDWLGAGISQRKPFSTSISTLFASTCGWPQGTPACLQIASTSSIAAATSG